MQYRFQEAGSTAWHYMPALDFRALCKQISSIGLTPPDLRIQILAQPDRWIDCGKVAAKGVRHIPTNQVYATEIGVSPGTLWHRIRRGKKHSQDWQITGV
jgi:hypothetical protein